MSADRAAEQIDLFLDMIAAERGASRNTIDAYRRDLVDYAGFLKKMGATPLDAGPCPQEGHARSFTRSIS